MSETETISPIHPNQVTPEVQAPHIGQSMLGSEVAIEKATADPFAGFEELLNENDPQANKDSVSGFISSFSKEIALGTDSEQAQSINTIFSNPNFLAASPEVAKQLFINPAELNVEPVDAQKIMRKILQGFGLGEEAITEIGRSIVSVKAERNGSSRELQGHIFERTIKNLAEIAAQSPEAPVILAKQFGIRNFYRYSPQRLVEQVNDMSKVFDFRDTQLVISALDDHNGALSNPQKYDESPQTVRTIFAEAGSLHDVARRLLTVKSLNNKNYSLGVQRLIIAGHGSKNSLSLGFDYNNGLITKQQVQESIAAQKLVEKGVLVEGADILLASCSTGKKDGLAQTISEVTSFKVIAADEVSHQSIVVGGDKKIFKAVPSSEERYRPSAKERVKSRATRWMGRGPSSTTVYRGSKKDNVRGYTLSRRPYPGARGRSLV